MMDPSVSPAIDNWRDLARRRRWMTNVALAKESSTQESNPYDEEFPTTLFLICHPIYIKLTARQYTEIVQKLPNTGFSKEYRNCSCETPFLLAALLPHWRLLTVMRLLMTHATDIHAVDNQERAAVRFCLNFSQGFNVAYYVHVCRDYRSRHNGQAISEGGPKEDCHSTELTSEVYAEDESDPYASPASIDEVLDRCYWCNECYSWEGQDRLTSIARSQGC